VFIKRYTRPVHREAWADGCPMASLCGEVARPERAGPIRTAFTKGLSSLIERLGTLIAGKRKKVPREEVLATVSMLVGALVLSRATEGEPISDEFLSSARKVLLES
jgi:TetR/AcrR family transcriptional repressor of nem operon